MQFVRRFAVIAAASAAASRSTAEPAFARPAAVPADARRADAPQPIDAEQLKLVGGGAGACAPVNRWRGL